VNSIRVAMYGGVLFGVAVLAGIYYLNSRSRTDRADKGRPAVPPVVRPVPADPKEAVLQAIRSSRSTVNAEIVRWWPPKQVAMNGPERLLCRVIFRFKEGKTWTNRDAVFEVGPTVRAIQVATESAETHRSFDPFFPCEDCAFSPEALRNAAIKEELLKLDGTWVVQAVLLDPPGKDEWKGSRCVIKDAQVTGSLPGEKSAPAKFTIKIIDPTSKKADILPEGAKDPIPAVYFLNRERLIVCWTSEKNVRPTQVHPRAKGDIVVAFRRE